MLRFLAFLLMLNFYSPVFSSAKENIISQEPFKGLFTQGMVCHETYKDKNNNWLTPDEIFSEDDKNYYVKKDKQEKVIVGPSESMSKSKKNTIDPERMIESYGADAVRLFILSDSPPEKDIQWSEQGMIASYKFINKFWGLHKKILISENIASDTFDESLEQFTNQILLKMNVSLNKFSYNVIVANLHEIYTFFNKVIESKIINNNLISNYIKILTMMLPITPHLANECLSEIANDKKFYWPEINKKYLENNKYNIVIQINGKKRGLILIEYNISKDDLSEKIKKESEINKFLNGKNVIKSIYIENKLINLIIK